MNPSEHPLLAPVLAGDRRSIARAITTMEVEGPASGALRAGLCADVLVVDGNPLEDLSALLRPILIVARGRLALRSV